MSIDPKNPEPEIGMGATVCFISDQQPCTILKVMRSKSGDVQGVVVQRETRLSARTRMRCAIVVSSMITAPTPREKSRPTLSERTDGMFVRMSLATEVRVCQSGIVQSFTTFPTDHETSQMDSELYQLAARKSS